MKGNFNIADREIQLFFLKYSCKKLFLTVFQFFFLAFLPDLSFSQEVQYHFNHDSLNIDPETELIIDEIFIVGNRKTKEHIILRELEFHEGSRLKLIDLEEIIEKDKQKLINTRLFMSVDFNLIDLSGDRIDIIIRVFERWYFFPFPIFELADRNFVDWWVNQEHDLKRVEYGIKLYQYNMRGRNETLKFIAQFGFTKRFELAYTFPYIDKDQKWGLGVFGGYSTNKNMAYKTDEHKRIFLDSESRLRERIRTGMTFTFRPSFYYYHGFSMNFFYTHVQDTIMDLNPNYFLHGNTEQRFFEFSYTFVRDLRDIAQYPLKGSYLMGSISKRGLGIYDDINQLEFSALYSRYWDLGKKFYLAGNIGTSLSFPESQPYNLLNAIGFRPFTLRGYELYVIEGQHFLNSKWTFKRLLVKGNPSFETFFRKDQFSEFPFAIYLKTYFDFAYVYNYRNYSENSLFTDELIYGGGAGIDLVTFYDMIFRFGYSINKDVATTYLHQP